MTLLFFLNPYVFGDEGEEETGSGGSGGGGLNWTPKWSFGVLKEKEIIEEIKTPRKISYKKKESLLDKRFRAFEEKISEGLDFPLSGYVAEKLEDSKKLSRMIEFLIDGSKQLSRQIKEQELVNAKEVKEEHDKVVKKVISMKKERKKVLAEIRKRMKEEAELKAFILNQYEEEALLVYLLLQ